MKSVKNKIRGNDSSSIVLRDKTSTGSITYRAGEFKFSHPINGTVEIPTPEVTKIFGKSISTHPNSPVGISEGSTLAIVRSCSTRSFLIEMFKGYVAVIFLPIYSSTLVIISFVGINDWAT